MRDVDPETPCEHCEKLRSGFCSLSSFASHRSTCKKNKKKKQKTEPAAAAAKQSKAAAAAAAKRNRATGIGDPSLPLELGSTVDVFFGMRPDPNLLKSSAVIVDVARVVQFDQSERYAGLQATTSNAAAATCQYAYQLDYKDDAQPLKLPGSGKITPLCEPV